MYYVSGKSIYLMQKDSDKNVYREVKLVRDEEGNIVFEVQPSGISQKPKVRQICSAQEVIAQLGSSAKMREPVSDEGKSKLKM